NMKEIGIVNSIRGNEAKVIIQRNAACGDCGACQVGKDKLTMEATAINVIGAKEGDKVEVEMKFVNVLRASFIMYGIPLIMFIVGSIIGYYYSSIVLEQPENPIFSFLFGIILTAITYFVIKYLDSKGKFSHKYEPQITNIID
ncbi:MAG: SoxR reducing system RseC family protein, partial [Eubacteriaceae bacterium]